MILLIRSVLYFLERLIDGTRVWEILRLTYYCNKSIFKLNYQLSLTIYILMSNIKLIINHKMKHRTNSVLWFYNIQFYNTIKKYYLFCYSFAGQEKKKLRSMNVMRIIIMVITVHQFERLDTWGENRQLLHTSLQKVIYSWIFQLFSYEMI